MRLIKRILGALALLLGTIGLIGCLFVGVGVWVVKEPVTTKATQVYDRADNGLAKAEKGLDLAQQKLDRAEKRLAEVKEERRKAQESRDDRGRRAVARMVKQTLGLELSGASDSLHTVAEAVVVVNSVLEDLANFPYLSVTGLDADRLRDMNERLDGVGSVAWELSLVLGDGENKQADQELSTVEGILKMLQERIADYLTQVKQVRQRAAEVKARTLFWITPAAILISSVSFWLALSQICILTRAWSWVRPSGGAQQGT
jgi:hypothetical protein